MTDRDRAEAFIADHDLESDPSTWIHDLQAELGEVAKELLEASGYGDHDPKFDASVRDEIGDLYFSLLGLAAELDVDLSAALDDALQKYRDRAAETGDPGSG